MEHVGINFGWERSDMFDTSIGMLCRVSQKDGVLSTLSLTERNPPQAQIAKPAYDREYLFRVSLY